MKISSTNSADSLESALSTLRQLVIDGLEHGFFEYAVKSEIVKDKKRRLQIQAGKTIQFTIDEAEIPNSKS